MSKLKKAVIISPFFRNGYEIRTKYIINYFQDLGYSTLVLTSDFDHREKKYIQIDKPNVKAIHAKPYYKNLSFARIASHIDFAKRVIKLVEDINPELLYVSGPPNYLYYVAGKYKKNHINCETIYEIGDMWPETMPISQRSKKILAPIFSLWSYYRNSSLPYADAVVYECSLFKQKLSKYRKNKKNYTIYLCKENVVDFKLPLEVPKEELGIAYVGTINNIIDIDLIVDFLDKLNRKRNIRLDVIGSGEKKVEMLDRIKQSGINVNDYGVIYDDAEKGKILRNCQFGLNIMKPSVMVGATMKSLEYFHWGLGIINNISADTWDIVNNYKCGVNISKKNIDEVAENVANLSPNNILDIRKMSRKVYLTFFDERIIKKQFMDIFHNE